VGATVFKVATQRRHAGCAEERDPFLLALPSHAHLAASEVKVFYTNGNDLCDSEPGAVEKLDQRCVSQRKRFRLTGSRRIDESCHLICTQHIGEPTLALRACQRVQWISRHAPLAYPESVEGTERRESLLHC